MIAVYIRGKQRRAEDREIKTTVYNLLKNSEAIGNTTTDYQKLVTRVTEHLDNIELKVSNDRIEDNIKEMLLEGMITKKENGKIGLK